MKRLGLFVYAVLFAISLLGVFSTTHVLAQNTVIDAQQAQQAGLSLPSALPPQLTQSQAIDAVTPPNATPGTPGTQAPKDTGKCGVFGSSSIINCISAGVEWLIKNTILEIAGFFLWLTTSMFNYAVQTGVLDFSTWATNALYPLWLIVRQIVSLLVVFIGLYLGFMYILGKDDKLQRYMPWVVMFALFVNFSYPLVRSAIDISNIISLNIYTSAVGIEALDPKSGVSAGSVIVSKLGLSGLASSATAGGTGMHGSINSIPGALLAVCYVLYAAYIFFMVTALFVLRTAALVFLIVASPLLLIDSIFPMLGEKAKLLRKILFEQLVVAPIFMIMLALTLKFLDVFSGPNGPIKTAQFGQGLGGSNDTVVVFFNILMMLIMLWIMLKVTKSSAGSLGEYATNAMGTVGSFAVGAATGGIAAGSGLLARKGIGGLAAKARDSGWVTRNQDSFIGKRAYNLSNAVANSTFDIRNTAVAQKASGKMGFSMGMGTKMGYDEESKANLEKRKKDLLDRSSRIKTHYERDVYKENMFGKKKLDANGQAILLHKKGDLDEKSDEAKRRFATNSGGALFLTRKQKEAIDDSLMGGLTTDNEKIRADIDKDSAGDVSKYSSLKSKPEKANFVSKLEAQLAELQKTDPNRTGKQSKSIMKTLEDIERKDAEEKAALDRQVQSVLANYKKKKDEDKLNYLTNQSDEVQAEISRILEMEKGEKAAAKEAVANGPLDLDLNKGTPLTGAALRGERLQKVADGRASNVEGARKELQMSNETAEGYEKRKKEVMDNYNNDLAAITANATTSSIVDANGRPMYSSATQSQISELDRKRDENLKYIDRNINKNESYAQNDAELLARNEAKQEASRAKAEVFSGNRDSRGGATVDYDITQPFNVEEVSTMSFAEKQAAIRAAKQATAAQAANAQMDRRPGIQVPGTPTPSVTAQAPSTPAANQPTRDAGIAA